MNHKGAGSTAILAVLGVALIVLWLVAIDMQIQTTQAFILGGHGGIVPNVEIFMQPVDLIQGNVTPELAKAIFISYVIELAVIVCTVGFEVSHSHITKHNSSMAKHWKFGLIACFAINFWSDFQYGYTASGFFGQVMFGLLCALAVAFFGIAGGALVETALGHDSHEGGGNMRKV